MRCVEDGVCFFVARVAGAVNAVVYCGRGTHDAAFLNMTNFGAVAEEAVVTGDLTRNVEDFIEILIADVFCAFDLVGQFGGFSVKATLFCVADFSAVAKEAIVAEPLVGLVDDGVCFFVTRIFGASDAIVEGWGLACDARASLCVTELHAITEEGIVTVCVTDTGGSGNATTRIWVTVLGDVTEGVVGDVEAALGFFITSVLGAVDVVIACDVLARDTGSVVTGFISIAQEVIVAVFVALAFSLTHAAACLYIANLSLWAEIIIGCEEALAIRALASITRAVNVVLTPRSIHRDTEAFITEVLSSAAISVVAIFITETLDLGGVGLVFSGHVWRHIFGAHIWSHVLGGGVWDHVLGHVLADIFIASVPFLDLVDVDALGALFWFSITACQ